MFKSCRKFHCFTMYSFFRKMTKFIIVLNQEADTDADMEERGRNSTTYSSNCPLKNANFKTLETK